MYGVRIGLTFTGRYLVLRFILAHMRGRVGRSVALLAGVLVATTGFTVLTASTAASRLAVIGTIQERSRAAYQILVRPPGARTALERDRGLVRPNFLAGRYGGITPEQWRQVQQVSGVQVAAPIAMAGYGMVSASVGVDFTDAIDPHLDRQMLALRLDWRADRGLTHTSEGTRAYVYVTRRPVLWPPPARIGEVLEPAFPGARNCPDGIPPPWEVEPDGRRVPLCMADDAVAQPDPNSRTYGMVVQLLPDGRLAQAAPPDGAVVPLSRATLIIRAPMPLLVAAIDPDSEASLVGLDRAVVTGRYLTSAQQVTRDPVSAKGVTVMDVPTLVASHTSVDEQVGADIARDTQLPPDRAPTDLSTATLNRHPATSTGIGTSADVDEVYQRALAEPDPSTEYVKGEVGILLTQLVRVGQPGYTVDPNGDLRPVAQPPAFGVFAREDASDSWLVQGPWLAHDNAFRTAQKARLTADPFHPEYAAIRAGTFDPGKVTGFDPLTSVPMETYAPAQATGADPASQALLKNQPLLPSDNLAGYLATSPSVLMSLASLHTLQPGNKAPISAVRVRVAGVTGYDAVSRERVRLVAEAIAERTGLDVDILLGSSPAPQTVALAAGSYGRPALRIAEPWAKLNVAAHLIHAVDRKSAALFGLILTVCVLFLGNAVAAAVRDRRQELAVLACLGWPRWRIFAAVLGEVALIGLTAGLLSAGLAVPLGLAAGASVPIRQVLLAVPVAVGLSLIAGVQPALRGSRAHPARGLAPAVVRTRRAGRRAGRRRLIFSLAMANLRRTPGRTLLGATALAIGVCALTLLAVVQSAFHGQAVGSLLGDAVSVQVRGVDLVAVLTTVLLGAFAVSDVLYLNTRDRAPELAALRALGWSAGALDRLIGYEGLGIGLLGATAGSGAAIAITLGLLGSGGRTTELFAVAGTCAAAGVVVAVLAAAVPALLLRRRSTAHLLAEE
jgi:putative ABC transport system permease protein